MDVYSFNYQKPGDIAQLRFVAVNISGISVNSLGGYDLVDGKYKTFLRSRMDSSPLKVATVGNYSEVTLLSKKELFAKMNYNSDHQAVVNHLNIDDVSLSNVASKLLGIPISYVGNSYFIVKDKKFINYAIKTQTETVFMVVTQDKVSFTDGKGQPLTEIEFARKVLS